ncbi:MAG: hypothetical protein JW821_10275, partial [Deltaproteobacteria bacterium]|nr:hypothetical protein [Deltaproteobacteria bacterium]
MGNPPPLHCLVLALILSVLTLAGCAAPPAKMPASLPSIVREHKHLYLHGGEKGMIDTGVDLRNGDTYAIFATGSIDYCPLGRCNYRDVRPEQGWPFIARIGHNNFFPPISKGMNSFLSTAYYPGRLYVGYREGGLNNLGQPQNPKYYMDDTGAFSVDIIVFEKEDYGQIAGFLEEMQKKDPSSKAVAEVLDKANRLHEWFLARKEATREIEKTRQEIQELKKEPPKAAP